eukprot:10835149-Ditylum_brightwellii.AAC.1
MSRPLRLDWQWMPMSRRQMPGNCSDTPVGLVMMVALDYVRPLSSIMQSSNTLLMFLHLLWSHNFE